MKTRAPILASIALALALGGAIGAGTALIVTAQPVVAAPAPTQIEAPPNRGAAAPTGPAAANRGAAAHRGAAAPTGPAAVAGQGLGRTGPGAAVAPIEWARGTWETPGPSGRAFIKREIKSRNGPNPARLARSPRCSRS